MNVRRWCIHQRSAISFKKRTKRMFTLQRIETSTQEIKKSRFLAVAGPIADEQAARAFLAAHADPAANHNCWAWRLGQTYRFSDDGEPSGTAGKPILAAIDGQKLDRVAVVVTRWFGGILLGSGGLMRASNSSTCRAPQSPATSPIWR
jgi:putative IMPACT (imprinted ancient) family translation regulator